MVLSNSIEKIITLIKKQQNPGSKLGVHGFSNRCRKGPNVLNLSKRKFSFCTKSLSNLTGNILFSQAIKNVDIDCELFGIRFWQRLSAL